MAPIVTPVYAIVAGKISIKLHVRVINVWTVSEFHNPAEDSSIHMLLLDEKVCLFFDFLEQIKDALIFVS